MRARVWSVVALSLLCALAAAGCGGSTGAMPAERSDAVLRPLLTARGIHPGAHQRQARGSPRRAWAAFKEFARLPVAQNHLAGDPEADGFLYEWGTYDFGGDFGRTFELDFARQYVFADDHIEQVHLDIHFPPAPFRSLGESHAWSFDLPGSGRDEWRRRWIELVEASPAFRAVMTSRVLPLGYEVWQEDVD